MRLKAHTLRYVIPAKEVFWAFRYKSLGLSFARFHEQDHDLGFGFYQFGSLGAAFEEIGDLAFKSGAVVGCRGCIDRPQGPRPLW